MREVSSEDGSLVLTCATGYARTQPEPRKWNVMRRPSQIGHVFDAMQASKSFDTASRACVP